MTTTHPAGDPRHTFLKPQEVIVRYRWGRTRGYLEPKETFFPRPIGGATAIAIPLVEPVSEQASSLVCVPTPTPTDHGPADPIQWLGARHPGGYLPDRSVVIMLALNIGD